MSPSLCHRDWSLVIAVGLCGREASHQSRPLPPRLLQCRLCRIAIMWLATTADNLELVGSTGCWRTQVWSHDAIAAQSALATNSHESQIQTPHFRLPLPERQCTVVPHWSRSTSVDRRSGLRSADTLSVDIPKTCTLLGDRAFSVARPCAWNSLPLNVSFLFYSFICKATWSIVLRTSS
jgi:hypothetical protein